METWLGLLMGAATGAITVATGIFVIPGTPYLHSLSFERDCAGIGAVVHRFNSHACRGACLYRAFGNVAGRTFAFPPRRRAYRNVAGTTRAPQDQGRNVPGVVFRRPGAARRPSGAAWGL